MNGDVIDEKISLLRRVGAGFNVLGRRFDGNFACCIFHVGKIRCDGSFFTSGVMERMPEGLYRVYCRLFFSLRGKKSV